MSIVGANRALIDVLERTIKGKTGDMRTIYQVTVNILRDSLVAINYAEDMDDTAALLLKTDKNKMTSFLRRNLEMIDRDNMRQTVLVKETEEYMDMFKTDFIDLEKNRRVLWTKLTPSKRETFIRQYRLQIEEAPDNAINVDLLLKKQ